MVSSSNISPLISILLFLLYSSVHCFSYTEIYRGFVVTERMRLGSRPPSCHNKCNQCHPCMAVQVASLPSHSRVQPESSATAEKFPNDYLYNYAGNRYSNYKPLGWRCRCGGHFYNP